MNNFYVPEGIGEDYIYIVPSNDYYDLYNTIVIEPNRSYTYYRFYYDLDNDLYTTNTRNGNNYNTQILNAITVQPTHNYIYRKDFADICIVSFIICFCIVLLLNIITSIFKKGGVLSGLF